jgi:uncharacterized protein YkwD
MPRKLAVTAALIVSLAICILVALGGSASPASADPQLDSEEQAFVILINNYRQANGLGPLTIDWEMQASSDWMSNDMGVKAYFSHTDSLGRDPWTRMCAFGYCYNTWMGENIAAGFTTARSVFCAWQNSPGHNANMLGANYTAMGISRVYTAGSPYGWYWTNDFGGVNSNATPPGSATPTPSTTPTCTPSPTPAPTPSPTLRPTPSPTPRPTPSPTPTPTPSPMPESVLPPPPAPTNTPAGPVKGDIDCNGQINAKDVIGLLEAVGQMGRLGLSGCTSDLDVNCDGHVDANDALALLLAIAQHDLVPPNGCAPIGV